MSSIADLIPGRVRTSDLLANYARHLNGERVTLGELVALLGNRSFGLLLLLFALPNLVPLPPGSSTVFGLPLLLLGEPGTHKGESSNRDHGRTDDQHGRHRSCRHAAQQIRRRRESRDQG